MSTFDTLRISIYTLLTLILPTMAILNFGYILIFLPERRERLTQSGISVVFFIAIAAMVAAYW